MIDAPGITVVALVFISLGDTLLLVKQGYEEAYWSLPGGTMEPGESIEQAAIREVKEETGLEIRLGRLIGLYSKPGDSALAICFEGFVTGGTLHPDHEITECRYFPLDDLPTHVRPHLHQRIADWLSNLPHAVVRTQ